MKFCPNDSIEMPHGNSFVWRYMSDWKFEYLVDEGALFFPNATKLTDEYEVTIPDRAIKEKRNQLRNEGLSGRDLEEEMAAFFFQSNPKKEFVLVNCWSVRPDESYALWKIYLDGEKNGVAVRSTVSKLRTAIEDGKDPIPEEFFIGKVRYQRHVKPEDLERLPLIITKKPYYDFEDELRVIILNYPRSEGGHNTSYNIKDGRSVRVDVPRLIQRIYISPFSDSEYRQKIEEIVGSNFGETAKQMVLPSEIRDQ